MILRHQLAAFSPISLSAALSGLAPLVRLAPQPYPQLVELLRQYYGASGVVLCGSGTQALQLALEQSSRHSTDDRPVALPAFGCFDLVSAAIGARARISLYDIDPLTLRPDRSSLEAVLRADVRACVLTPLYGLPLPWDELSELGDRYGVPLIEDAAQGHGASWHGRPLGSLGTVSTISFGRGKGWTGGGGGAMLMRGAGRGAPTSGPAAPDAVAEVRALAGLLAQWALGRPSLYGLARAIPSLSLGSTLYHAPDDPSAMTRAAMATVLATGADSTRESETRRENACLLRARLASIEGVRTFEALPAAEAGDIRLPVRVERGCTRGPVAPDARRLGIERSYPRSLARLPEASPWLASEVGWPGAEALADQLVTLPTHSFVSATDRDKLVQAVERMAQGR